MRRVRFSFLAGCALIAFLAGCDAILNFGQFDFNATDAGTADAGDAATNDSGNTGDGGPNTVNDAGDAGDAATCNVDLTTTCYACDPTTTDQYLNSCNSGITQCLQFDPSRVAAFLIDGGLPPVPDGGVQ